MAIRISSPAFANGSAIPDRYAMDGDNASPPLEWSGAPPGTRSFALVVEDPDAPSGTFRHWALYDIPADRTKLAEGEGAFGFGEGVNDFGRKGYDGPRPPRGHGPHHYHFRVAALDIDHLDVAEDVSAANVWDEARRHAIEQAEIVGIFETR